MATFLTRAINRAALSVGLESSTGRTVAGSFQVGVSFARPVTGFGLDDVRVVNGRATSLAGLGSDYEVTVVPAAEGTVVVRIPEGAARDTAGSPNQASGLLVRTFGSGGYRDGPGFDVWDRDVVVSAYRAEFEREQPDHRVHRQRRRLRRGAPPARPSGTVWCSGSTGTGRWQASKPSPNEQNTQMLLSKQR